jgi:predicted nucleic acid-binding protein
LTEVVLDASVVLRWLGPTGERGSAEARRLREQQEEGELWVVIPGLIILEVLNVAGRQWNWPGDALRELVAALEQLALDVVEPALASVVEWVDRGLTAYDAVYVALAEERGIPLVTDDRTILEIAREVAQPLVPA